MLAGTCGTLSNTIEKQLVSRNNRDSPLLKMVLGRVRGQRYLRPAGIWSDEQSAAGPCKIRMALRYGMGHYRKA